MTEGLSEIKRYYFYRDQLLAVAVAFAIASVSILILGIITGRHIEQSMRAEYQTAAVKIPVKPPMETQVTGETETGEVPGAESPAPESAPLLSSDEGTAKERKAQGVIAEAEKTQATARVENPVKSARRAPAAENSAGEAGLSQAGQGQRQISQPVKKESLERVWTVQVKSSPEKKYADHWADRLRSKGYDAFVVDAVVKGQTWYRVRVGHLAVRQEAEALRATLESKERLSGSFLTAHKPVDRVPTE